MIINIYDVSSFLNEKKKWKYSWEGVLEGVDRNYPTAMDSYGPLLDYILLQILRFTKFGPNGMGR